MPSFSKIFVNYIFETIHETLYFVATHFQWKVSSLSPPLGGLRARHCCFSKFDKLKPPRVKRSIGVNLKYGTRHKDGQRAEGWKEGPMTRLKYLKPTTTKQAPKMTRLTLMTT